MFGAYIIRFGNSYFMEAVPSVSRGSWRPGALRSDYGEPNITVIKEALTRKSC